MTEQQLANEIIGWAHKFKWLVFHVRNSGMGGMTQVQGDKGWPDLFMVRGSRVIAAELKIEKRGTKRGDPRPDQWKWLDALANVGNELWHPIDCHVWRPEDLPAIIDTLRRR